MEDEDKTRAQAIINALARQRLGALDDVAQMAGEIALRDAKIVELQAVIDAAITDKEQKNAD